VNDFSNTSKVVQQNKAGVSCLFYVYIHKKNAGVVMCYC